MNFRPVSDFIQEVLVEEKGVPGCDVQICRSHEVLYQETFGARNYTKTEPARRDDIYFLYSCTKPITCAAGAGYGYGLGVRTLVDRSEGQLSIVFAMHVKNWPTLIGCGHAPIRDMSYDILGL